MVSLRKPGKLDWYHDMASVFQVKPFLAYVYLCIFSSLNAHFDIK